MKNILDISTRQEFRDWLSKNSKIEVECYISCIREKPTGDNFTYLDAVEEALCFGWIDSIFKKVGDKYLQRFSPRNKNSPWSELNKERVRRLIKIGLMTKEGRKVLPSMRYKEDIDVIEALKKARVYSKFKKFPPLYQRVRIYNISFFKDKDVNKYNSSLAHLIDSTKKGEMFGNWNDYGRLLDY